MKNLKKVSAILLAVMMMLAVSVTAFAANGTIKITPPEGLDGDATNTYKIYKVFDAVGTGDKISYKLVEGKTTVPDGFKVDAGGNVLYTANENKIETDDGFVSALTDDDIEAIKGYVTDADLVDTITATGSADVTSKELPNGFYYITTTTGTVVTIDSTNPAAEVIDKNTVPSVDKTITGASSVDENGKKALAQVGTVVNYSAKITIGVGAKDYVFHDTMDTGLTYNNDAVVTGVEAGDTTYSVGKEGTDTFTINFVNDYIKTLDAGEKLTVTYSATVTDDAITTDPLNNTCYVSYGDKNADNRTPESKADVYEAKFTVTKQDGDEKPLADAGFVIKNAADKYYKIENKVVSWVDSIDDATEYMSDAQGAVPSFTGLANGTYTLVEKTVPGGYNKAADINFTIAEHDYTAANLEQEATVTNQAGSVLPSTGGMGTTLFTIIGTALMAGAVVIFVAKRKMA